MKKKSHEILGVAPDAPVEEVKKAFRKKSKKCHPDAGGNNVEFNELLIAYNDMNGKADLPPPSQALNILTSLYHSMLEHFKDQILYIDIPNEMRNQLVQQQANINNQIAANEKRIKLLHSITKQCKCESIVTYYNASQIADLTRQNIQINHQLTDLGEAIAMVTNIKYAPAAKPPPTRASYTNGFTKFYS